MEAAVVKKLKISRDVDAIRARHAVTAMRAGYDQALMVLLPYLFDALKIRFSKRSDSRAAGAVNIFNRLLHSAHTA